MMSANGYIRSSAWSSFLSLLLYGSGFLTIFSPLPMAVLLVKRGRSASLLAAVMAVSVLVLFFFSLHGPLLMFPIFESLKSRFIGPFSSGAALFLGSAHYVYYLIIGLIVGEALVRAKGATTALWMGLLFSLSFAGLVFVIGQYGFSWQILESNKELFLNALAGVAEKSELPFPSGEIAALAFRLMPSFVFIFSLLTIAFNVSLAHRLTSINTKGSQKEGFRFPDNLVWALIGSWGLFFLNIYVLRYTMLEVLTINALLIFASLYFLQGFSLLLELAKGINAPFARMLFFVGMVVFFQIVGFFIIGLGVADVWLNIRTRSKSAREHS